MKVFNYVTDIYGEPIPHNRQFAEKEVAKLEELALEIPLTLRYRCIEKVTDMYFYRFNKRLDTDYLYRLTNVVLADELRSKVKIDSGILSEAQLNRRKNGAHVRKELSAREVPLSKAVNIGIDGRDYAIPRRSFADPYK